MHHGVQEGPTGATNAVDGLALLLASAGPVTGVVFADLVCILWPTARCMPTRSWVAWGFVERYQLAAVRCDDALAQYPRVLDVAGPA